MRLRALAMIVLLASLTTFQRPAAADPQAVRTLIPIGASYQAATLDLFVQEAIAHNSDAVVELRILPIAFAITSPYTISQEERDDNYALAVSRANQIDARCELLVPSGVTCAASVPDIQIRDDSFDQAKVGMLGSNVDGVYILGGDQQFAMIVTANTPAETALEALYTAGAPISGNSAGAAVQSRYMIGGYAAWAWPEDGLRADALDLWYAPTTEITRGLRFALDAAIVDQHVLERGRMARLLQAVYLSPGPKLGVGVDWGTGVRIRDERYVSHTAGFYTTVIYDQETYGAAAGASFNGGSLAIQGVALHLLPEGDYAYDLETRQPTMGGVTQPAPNIAGRGYGMLARQAGSGPLILGGDVRSFLYDSAFTSVAVDLDGRAQPLLLAATGYLSATQAADDLADWEQWLSDSGITNVTTMTVGAGDAAALSTALDSAGGVVLFGRDPDGIAALLPGWRAAGVDTKLAQLHAAGAPIVLDNAMAAAAGETMVVEAAPTDDNLEYQSSDSFLSGDVSLGAGLGLIQSAAFEPRALYDYRYGRLVSVAVSDQEHVAFGIERGTALRLTSSGASVLGDSSLFIVDGRYAKTLEAGDNDAFAASWLLVDTFSPGQQLPIDEADPGGLFLPLVRR